MNDFFLNYFIFLESEHCDFFFYLLQLTLNNNPHLFLTGRLWLALDLFSSPTKFQDCGFNFVDVDFDVGK